MKKWLIIFLIIGLYLYLSYTHFYNFLGQKHLTAPAHGIKTIFANNLSSQTIKYAALGDSLTAGVGVYEYKNSFPYLIAQNLASKSTVELSNFALAGATSKDVLENQVSQALLSKPDFITILVGINDIHNLKSLKEFENNYATIVNALQRQGVKIYLLSIPYLGSDKIIYFPYNLILDFRTKQFNGVVKSIATRYGAQYIDLNLASKPAYFYSSDEFHPGEGGYKEWLKVVNVN